MGLGDGGWDEYANGLLGSLYVDRVRLFCSDPTLLPDIKTIEFVFAEGRNHLRCHCRVRCDFYQRWLSILM